VDAGSDCTLEGILYGGATDDPRLPLPNEIVTIFGTGETDVDLTASANQPTFVSGTGVITLPTVTGVQWKVNGANKAPGAQPRAVFGCQGYGHGKRAAGYNITGDDDWTFSPLVVSIVRGRDSQVRVAGNS
jgi:hypothetical protein